MDRVGARVELDGFDATVRFVGTPPQLEGVWLGLEFDDASRGKHSGVVQGVQLFECSQQGAGALVRTANAKLRRGRSLGDALMERISEGERPLKRRRLALDGQRIATANAEPEQAALLADCEELDLSRNLFTSLREALDAAALAPCLRSLAIDSNRFTATSLPDDPRALAKLETLSASSTLLDWPSALALARHCPSLRDLSLGLNGYTSLSQAARLPASLRSLNLEGNSLASWSAIVSLLRDLPLCPSLSTLLLAGNALDAVADGPPHALRVLSLRDNRLAQLDDLQRLAAQLPHLRELVVAGNSCTAAASPVELRKLVIRLFPSLIKLDRAELAGAVGVREAAAPAKPARPPAAAGTLASRLVALSVLDPSGDAGTVRVLPSMTVAQLRIKLAATQKRSLAPATLALVDGADELELDDDAQTLAACGVREGLAIRLSHSQGQTQT